MVAPLWPLLLKNPRSASGSERETQTSLQAQNTDSERLLSAASHVSDEKRKGWLLLVTVMIEIVKWISKYTTECYVF